MQIVQHFLLILGILSSVTSHRINFYRSDYTYVQEHDAFYKLHWDTAGKGWEKSFLACENEGSILFYPKVVDEWKVINALMKLLDNKPNTTDVFVGVHNKFGLTEYITVDGHSTPLPMGDDFQSDSPNTVCVTIDASNGKYKADFCNRLSPAMFVCKRVDEKLCPTIDREYKYSTSSGKCYKINMNAKSWGDAMQTCFMEGGLLTVEENPISVVPDITQSETYFVGFRDIFLNGDYYTIRGKRIAQRHISVESQRPEYPNPLYAEVNPDDYDMYQRPTTPTMVLPSENRCVATSDRRLIAKSCDDELPFICEMEANGDFKQ